jgi:TolB-like protein
VSAKPSFFAELQRRNVYKVGAMYAVAGWLLVQVVTQVLPIFDVPALVQRIIVLAIVAGFPLALVLSWVYELTPQGIVKTDEVTVEASVTRQTGQRLNRAIIGVLLLAVLVLAAKLLWSAGEVKPAASTVIAANEKSIAVLPFVNMSGEAANEYFSDGITEEILNAAAQLPGLRVAARTSAFQFKGQNIDLRKVGETLSVAYVLEGSLQRAGDQVRITAQLIDAHSGYHRWSGKFDRKLVNVFSIEDEIANAIVAQLQLQLGDKPAGPLVKAGTGSPQAHELYLQGLSKMQVRGPALTDAAHFFEQAVTLDPGYAAAWGAWAQTLELLPWYELDDFDTSMSNAQQAAEKALSLDASVASAHAALATVLSDRGEYTEAGKAFDRALALDPDSAEILDQHAQYLFLIGDFAAGVEGERRAIPLDPLSPNPHLQLGIALVTLRQYDEARQQFEAALAAEPGFGFLHNQLAMLDAYSGRLAEAEQHARKGGDVFGNADVGGAVARAVADATQRPAALRLLGEVGRHQPAFTTPARAVWYCLLGDCATALRELETWSVAANRQDVIRASYFLGTPAFDPIRADPRFQAVLRKTGLPDYPIASVPRIASASFKTSGPSTQPP